MLIVGKMHGLMNHLGEGDLQVLKAGQVNVLINHLVDGSLQM